MRRSQNGRRNTRTAQGGVTLLELIVAVSILGTLSALLWGTFSRTWAGRVYAESRAETYAVARAAVSWIERDIAGTGAAHWYPDQAVLFTSRGLGDRKTNEFETALLHVTTASALGTAPLEFSPGTEVPLPGPQRGEQARVLYRLEAEEEFSTGRDAPLSLVRYEWRPPAEADREEASRAVIARGVRSLRLRFSEDGETWRETWDTSAPGLRHVPRVVETRLVLSDSDGEDVEFVSAVAVAIGGLQGIHGARGGSRG